MLLVIAVCALHLVLILFMVFDTKKTIYEPEEMARVMKVTDIAEYIPPVIEIPETVARPSQDSTSYSVIPQIDGIAEHMIVTDVIIPVTADMLSSGPYIPPQTFDDYYAMHQISKPPVFDENEFVKDIVYPSIALRSGIEGRVILELFVDRTGIIQRVTVLLEEPADRGFGEAAVKAFMGKKGVPAYANNEPVSSRYRYPFYFRIR